MHFVTGERLHFLTSLHGQLPELVLGSMSDMHRRGLADLAMFSSLRFFIFCNCYS